MESTVQKGSLGYWFCTWECCGHQLDLLLGKRYPERRAWRPRCPKCGADGLTATETYRVERAIRRVCEEAGLYPTSN